MEAKGKNALRLLTLVLLAFLFLLPCIAYAAGAQQKQSPISPQPNPLLNPNAPPQGSITITSPASGETWYTGGRKEIQWTCNGSSCSVVDVSLWKDSKQFTVIGTGVASGHTFYTMPSDAAVGNYELRVTSEYDTRVLARQSVTVTLPSITVTAPKANEQLSTGSQYTITWTYTGDPGPVNVYKKSGQEDILAIIAGSVTGSMGQGSVVWPIVDSASADPNVTPGPYTIVIKSKNNPSISASSGVFNIVCRYGTCSGACIDFQSDVTNCGSCGHRCFGGPINNGGYNCVSGSCVCKPTATVCGSECTDLNYDNKNCGFCGNQCAKDKGFLCIQGACQR